MHWSIVVGLLAIVAGLSLIGYVWRTFYSKRDIFLDIGPEEKESYSNSVSDYRAYEQPAEVKNVREPEPVSDDVPEKQSYFKGIFSDDEVRAIRAMENPDVVLLSDQYNCSVSTIKRLLQRKTYKHVA